jgi:hypothetical protein
MNPLLSGFEKSSDGPSSDPTVARAVADMITAAVAPM